MHIPNTAVVIATVPKVWLIGVLFLKSNKYIEDIDNPLIRAIGAIENKVSCQNFLGLIFSIGNGGSRVVNMVGKVTKIKLR
ncbi:Uncharacterised protein [Chlamydia trachomatis]|nr:Uncharacterised protein [Chlamydia trachomatis]